LILSIMPRKPDPNAIFVGLTSKQHEVLALVADHRTSKEIAGELQISESAVNQRIEAVRARLGGPTRAQMARTYREFANAKAAENTYKKMPWQRIQLPAGAETGQVAAAESVADRDPGDRDLEGNGLQLSANSFPALLTNETSGGEFSPAVLILSMLAIVTAGMMAAYFVTSMIGIG
jgi:DNA-binding CsgD family transcriptional regulator